jgi:hypothetical protein
VLLLLRLLLCASLHLVHMSVVHDRFHQAPDLCGGVEGGDLHCAEGYGGYGSESLALRRGIWGYGSECTINYQFVSLIVNLYHELSICINLY